MSGCPSGEVTVADNTIICGGARLGYAGGISLEPGWGRGSNENKILRNTIRGTGSWAISVEAVYLACERNMFIDNNLANFTTLEEGAVFFGSQANNNVFSGDVGARIIDLGTGNVIVK